MTTTIKKPYFAHDPVAGQIYVLGYVFRLPKSRRARIATGSLMIIGGLFGFLPILGYWMVPVGLLVLSQDFATVRRWRRSFDVYRGRRRQRKKERQDGL